MLERITIGPKSYLVQIDFFRDRKMLLLTIPGEGCLNHTGQSRRLGLSAQPRSCAVLHPPPPLEAYKTDYALTA